MCGKNIVIEMFHRQNKMHYIVPFSVPGDLDGQGWEKCWDNRLPPHSTARLWRLVESLWETLKKYTFFSVYLARDEIKSWNKNWNINQQLLPGVIWSQRAYCLNGWTNIKTFGRMKLPAKAASCLRINYSFRRQALAYWTAPVGPTVGDWPRGRAAGQPALPHVAPALCSGESNASGKR